MRCRMFARGGLPGDRRIVHDHASARDGLVLTDDRRHGGTEPVRRVRWLIGGGHDFRRYRARGGVTYDAGYGTAPCGSTNRR